MAFNNDYISKVIDTVSEIPDYPTRWKVAHLFADMLEKSNADFYRRGFFDDCYIKQPPEETIIGF